MANGAEKRISNINIGDKVMSYDKDKEETIPETVVGVSEPRYEATYVVVCVDDKNKKRAVQTTLAQPLFAEDGEFIEVGLMKLGTELKAIGKVISIEEAGEDKVYDFKTEKLNTYYANGFIVKGASDAEIEQ